MTSSDIDQFSNFFQCQNHENAEHATTPQMCRYTTL